MAISLRQDKWLLVGGLFVLLGSLFCGYQFYASWKTSRTVTLPVPDCDLRRGPCVSRLPSGEKIELHIKPTHMPVLTSVQLEVKTGIPVKKMYINFKGAEMNMGEFRSALLPHKEGSYSAQTILPTCIQDNMVWHAVVQIEAGNMRYSAPFVLINQRPTGT